MVERPSLESIFGAAPQAAAPIAMQATEQANLQPAQGQRPSLGDIFGTTPQPQAQPMQAPKEPSFLQQAVGFGRNVAGFTPAGQLAEATQAAISGGLPDFLREKGQQAEVLARGAAELPLGAVQAGIEQLPESIQQKEIFNIKGTPVTPATIRESIANVTAEGERIAEQTTGGAALKAIPQIVQTAPIAATSLLGLMATGAGIGFAQPTAEKDLEKALSNRLTQGAIGAVVPVGLKGLQNIPTLAAKLLRINPQAAKDFLEEGVQTSLASLSDSPAVQLADRFLSRFTGGAGVIQKNTNRTLDNIVRNLDELGAGSGVSATEAGEQIQKGVRNFVSRFQGRSKTLFEKLNNSIGKNEQFSVKKSVGLLEDIGQEVLDAPNLQARVQGSEGAKLLRDIVQDAGQNEGNLSYSAIRRYRTLVGNKLSNKLMDGEDAATLKRIYGALSDDMRGAAASKGEGVLRQFDRANKFYSAGIDRIENNLEKLIRNKTPEQVFENALSGTKLGGTKINKIMKSLKPEEQQVVRNSVLKKLGSPTPGSVGAVADDAFSPRTYLTNWNRLSNEAKDAIFSDKTTRKSLDTIANIADRLKNVDRFANPSGTNQQLSQGALFATAMYNPAAAGGAVIGANASARLMTNQAFVKALAKASTGQRITPAIVGKNIRIFENVAKNHPEIADDVVKYLTVVGGIASGLGGKKDEQ